MTVLYRATLETRNFFFEAVDVSAEKACETLRHGLAKHGEQYPCLPQWWEHPDFPKIEAHPFVVGVAYRDGGRITVDAKDSP